MIITQQILDHLSKDRKLAPYLRHNLKDHISHGDVYEGLLGSIVSQQLSVKAAATIYGRFLDLFEDKYPEPQLLLSFDDATLRSVDLSGQKTKYVRNVVEYFDENELYQHHWAAMTDDEIIHTLTAIKGVGRWTVEMILMFTLGRLDVLPLNDLGIQQAMISIYDLNEEKKELARKMEAIARRWQPYRSVACRYLWRYKDNPPLLKS